MRTKKILVQGHEIILTNIDSEDFISLTNMAEGFGGGSLIEKWLRNKNTIEFLGIWERINNPDFNSPEFEGIIKMAGLNRFTLSVKQWIELTGAKGLMAKAGRYGGTYAHKDIAFEFGSWLSPEFKLYLIKEFQRLKQEEIEKKSLGWDLRRNLAKINYRVHTDAVQAHLIPPKVSKKHRVAIYASEGDLLNVALFGMTAREWRNSNQQEKGNMRDYATVEQLVVLSNLESMNAELIKKGVAADKRLQILNEMAISQMKSLFEHPIIKKLEGK